MKDSFYVFFSTESCKRLSLSHFLFQENRKISVPRKQHRLQFLGNCNWDLTYCPWLKDPWYLLFLVFFLLLSSFFLLFLLFLFFFSTSHFFSFLLSSSILSSSLLDCNHLTSNGVTIVFLPSLPSSPPFFSSLLLPSFSFSHTAPEWIRPPLL